ncbi:hypothetical protein ACFQQB_51510 [Nonomuraea rubra]
MPELWTGAPVIAGLIGLALGALFLPNAIGAVTPGTEDGETAGAERA